MLPEVEIHCPYCGEPLTLLVDDSAGAQAYVEDCHVCCRPIEVAVDIVGDGSPVVVARAQDDA
ncbi:MAG: CPXCG motif-containing cysteine-rich protein [Luteimonas sp.]